MSRRPGELVKVESHEPKMGGAERTQNGGGEPWEDIPYCSNLVPSSSPDSPQLGAVGR